MSRSRAFASLASSVDSTGAILPSGISASVDLDGIDTYDSASLLPISGLRAGNQALVNDRLYITNGTGWYNVALLNLTPSITSGPDGAAYQLDSTNTVSISLVASDSDGTPIIWSFATSDSAYDLATITNDSDGSFNVTGKSLADILTAGYDSAGGSFTVTFKASDGISFDADSASFSLTYSVSSSGYDLTTLSFNHSHGLTDDNINATSQQDIIFNDDGSVYWMLDIDLDRALKFTCSTPWDISTKTYVGLSSALSVNEGVLQSSTWGADGSKFYYVGSGSDRLIQYSVSTPYSLDAITYQNLLNLSPTMQFPTGITFKPDGTRMFICCALNNNVYEYSLSPVWETSSPTLINTISLSPISSPYDISFNDDGSKFFILGKSNNSINEYSLSTPWDISSRTLVHSIITTETLEIAADDHRCIRWGDGGNKLYTIDDDTKKIYQFST